MASKIKQQPELAEDLAAEKETNDLINDVTTLGTRLRSIHHHSDGACKMFSGSVPENFDQVHVTTLPPITNSKRILLTNLGDVPMKDLQKAVGKDVDIFVKNGSIVLVYALKQRRTWLQIGLFVFFFLVALGLSFYGYTLFQEHQSLDSSGHLIL